MQRKPKNLISLIAILFGAIIIAGCGSTTESPDNTVAATVNGRKIMLQEVERMIQQQSQGKQAQLSEHDLAQARLQALDSLIQREALFQRAEQEKVLPSDEDITAAINNQKQQGGLTEEEFQKQLKDQGMTYEALSELWRKNLAISKLQDKYGGKITISDREVEEYYNNNKDQFVNRRGVGLAMIVVDPADNTQQGITNDAKGDAEAKTKIDDIYQQLKNGADFATIARAKSEDASLLQGGDVGFATEDQLKQNGFPPDLINQLMGPLQVGSYTAPIKFGSPGNPNGRWYIFKVQEKHLQNENLTLESQFADGDSVRHRINVLLTNQRKDILNSALVEVALSEAKIVNNLAADMLKNPSSLGLRPASSEAAKPASSPATNASPSAAKSTSSPGASPAKK